jgi:transcriptional regulator with XRE-family HTH domain
MRMTPLREARLRLGLTQETLALRSGVRQKTISQLENALIDRPSYDCVKRLTKAIQAAGLDVTDEDLFPLEKVS